MRRVFWSTVLRLFCVFESSIAFAETVKESQAPSSIVEQCLFWDE